MKLPVVRNIHQLGGRTTILEYNDPVMNYFNPAFEWEYESNRLRIAIRSCNFTTDHHGDWRFLDDEIYSKTDVLYGYLEPDTLEVWGLETLAMSEDTPIVTKIAGLEDVRLFQREDGMHAIGFETDRITPSLYAESCMAEYLIKNGALHYIRTLDKPEKRLVEKNWSPANVQTKEFDFTYSPTQVVKNGKVVGPKYAGNIHGGSQLLLQPDGTYLSIVHSKTADKRYGQVYDKYVYWTYLARHGKDGRITHLSEPFTFGTNENIEFASTMVELKLSGDVLIGFGVCDQKIGIARIALENLTKLLKPYIPNVAGLLPDDIAALPPHHHLRKYYTKERANRP